jgi:hypothetical protein
MHTYRPGNLRDEIPKRRRLWFTPGCNAMEEEEDPFLSLMGDTKLTCDCTVSKVSAAQTWLLPTVCYILRLLQSAYYIVVPLQAPEALT